MYLYTYICVYTVVHANIYMYHVSTVQYCSYSAQVKFMPIRGTPKPSTLAQRTWKLGSTVGAFAGTDEPLDPT